MEPVPNEDSQDCQLVFARLSEYLDAELPVNLCAEIATHLAGCRTCSESLDELRRTVEVCRGYRAGEAPAPVRQEVRDQLMEAYRLVLERRR
jgi:anti-sigma factor (TIGR02949 family)